MNILVFVKRVPDTESRIRIQHETRSIVEDGLNFVISPYDEFAVEEALRLREAKGGTVRVVSAGRDEAVTVLRKCLAMGADEAALVKDDAPETYDGLRTARIIARAVERKFGGADLLLFGKQAVGSDGSQVPSMVAEMLGLPQVNVVTKLEIEGDSGTALREVEGGMERVVFSLPAVIRPIPRGRRARSCREIRPRRPANSWPFSITRPRSFEGGQDDRRIHRNKGREDQEGLP
jgi:electron transfer flavoprotein beta subunit